MNVTVSPNAKPVIIDCDPGHDDAIAILLALGSPALDLKAVTTVFGNCTVEDATRNALQVLTVGGAEGVPVGQGAPKSRTGKRVLGNYVHGSTGLDGPALPDAAFTVDPRPAVELMRDVLLGSARKVTLIAIGPITNVAMLLERYPEVHPYIREIVFMGGSTERGNHTPLAEFNTYADPEALGVVLQSALPLRMIGLNLTHQALATKSVVDRIRALPLLPARIAAEWLGFFGASYEAIWSFESPPVHDPCAVAAVITPDIISWRKAFAAVETEGQWSRGAVAVDLDNRLPDHRPNVLVGMQLDTKAYWRLIIGALSRLNM